MPQTRSAPHLDPGEPSSRDACLARPRARCSAWQGSAFRSYAVHQLDLLHSDLNTHRPQLRVGNCALSSGLHEPIPSSFPCEMPLPPITPALRAAPSHTLPDLAANLVEMPRLPSPMGRVLSCLAFSRRAPSRGAPSRGAPPGGAPCCRAPMHTSSC